MKLLILQNDYFSLSPSKLMAIDAAVPGVEVKYITSRSLTPEQIAEADAIFGWPPRALLKYAVNLKWLHLYSSGVDRYADLNLYPNKNIMLTKSGGAHSAPVAEHTLALILALNRRLNMHFKNQLRHDWSGLSEHLELHSKTVCVVGLGSIGRELCTYLKAFGCRTLGVRRKLLLQPDFVDEQYTSGDLLFLLPAADYVCVCLPETDETKLLFSEREFTAMKRGAIFINIARGNIVDHDALYRSLESGRLGGAGLDVTVPEPLDPDSPLWDMDNVIITPHVAGESDGLDARRFELFLDLLGRFSSNGRMYNTVDFIRGY